MIQTCVALHGLDVVDPDSNIQLWQDFEFVTEGSVMIDQQ